MPTPETPTALAETPSAAPAQETPTEKAPADFMADIIGDLEQMDSGSPPEPKPKPAEKPKAEKPSDPQVEKPTAKTPEKQAETPAETKETPEPVKPVKAAELRTAYEGLKERVRKELEPEIQKLRSKVAEYEQRTPDESGPIQEKVKALEQRNAQLEQHMAFVDYTQSKDFQTNYQQPYAAAWNEAVAEFKELTVKEKSGEDEVGDPIIKTRPADENDILTLANMKLSDMDEAAKEMFGASSSRVIGHIQNIKRLSAAQHKAIQDAKTKALEWKNQQTSEFQNRAKVLGDIWLNVNKALEEKFPKAFKPEEGDEEDRGGHTKGFALADLLFLGPEGLSSEQVEALPASFKESIKAKKPLSEAQRVQLHALARLKMANHDRKVIALKRATDRIKELEKALEEYEKSEPSGKASDRGGHGESTKDWLQQAESEIRALDK